MLEWWEALIVGEYNARCWAAVPNRPGLFVFPITALFWYSAIKYFPSQFRYVSRRFAYYVFGDESVDILATILAYFAEWLNLLWFYIRGSPLKTGHVEL